PWARFVPCGLPGRGVTSVRAELSKASNENDLEELLDPDTVAGMWATLFAERLGLKDEHGVEAVARVDDEVVERLLRAADEAMEREDEARQRGETEEDEAQASVIDDFMVAEIGDLVMENIFTRL